MLGALLVLCGFYPQRADQLFGSAQAWVVTNFDWFYTVAVTGFLVFLVLIAWSRYGDIRLGPDDAKPEFSFASWTAMLFAAGMGIGLMYFGVGEPLQHYLNPPTQEAGTPAAAREALTSTFFHWGFQAWAIYGVMGLVLAYFGFRYNLPLTMRSGLYPLLQKRINGPVVWRRCLRFGGHDCRFGHHTGLWRAAAGGRPESGDRLGYRNHGVSYRGDRRRRGAGGSVRSLRTGQGRQAPVEVNLLITFALLGFVLLCGPTVFLLQAFSENIGNYLSSLVGMSLRTFTYEVAKDDGWFGGWTILYWAWWISWSPFVGMFIARISRGRTVREFIVGVLFIPTAFNLLWMTVFGNGAIWIDTHVAQGALSATASNVDALLFRFFEYLPLAKAVSWIAVLLIALFL